MRVDRVGMRFLTFPSAVLAVGLLASCATSRAMEPFATDGCSMFPDRSLISKKDWCGCCLAHDLAYWRGGTAEERLAADHALRTCVLKATKDPRLADLMYTGVRTGGGPYFFTPYRWGYGWSYGRGYKALTSIERSEAAALHAEYMAKNPTLMCLNNANSLPSPATPEP